MPIGPSMTNSKSVAIDPGFTKDYNNQKVAGYTCPSYVDKDVWVKRIDYPDTFSVTQSGQDRQYVTVRRTDSNEGWKIDLSFKCCVPGNLNIILFKVEMFYIYFKCID